MSSDEMNSSDGVALSLETPKLHIYQITFREESSYTLEEYKAMLGSFFPNNTRVEEVFPDELYKAPEVNSEKGA